MSRNSPLACYFYPEIPLFLLWSLGKLWWWRFDIMQIKQLLYQQLLKLKTVGELPHRSDRYIWHGSFGLSLGAGIGSINSTPDHYLSKLLHWLISRRLSTRRRGGVAQNSHDRSLSVGRRLKQWFVQIQLCSLIYINHSEYLYMRPLNDSTVQRRVYI